MEVSGLGQRVLLEGVDAEQRAEIVDSKEFLESVIDEPVRAFAYPYGTEGTFSEETVRIVDEEGFEVAFTTMARAATAEEFSDRPLRLAGFGGVAGAFSLPLILLAAPLESPLVLAIGTVLLGFGSGLFAVGTLTAAMDLQTVGDGGLAVGAWGAVHALSAGVAVALGGILRDVFAGLVNAGGFAPEFAGPAAGYMAVYQLEIVVIVIALVALGPLTDPGWADRTNTRRRAFGLPELPSG